MSDLRKAAEMALESWDFFFSQAHPEVVGLMYGSDWAKIAKERTEALRQALAQPDNFVYNEDKSYRFSPSTGSFGIGDTSAKREWVGLTDEDLSVFTTEFYNGAVWAEAKLKEKNSG